MKRRIMAVALVLFMLSGILIPNRQVMAAATRPENGVTSGTCGDNLKWDFSGDT